MSEAKEPRKSVITVAIKRLLATAQFENIEIKLETTEEVTWSDLKDRAVKVDKITKLLADQYKNTQTTVLNELGVEEKRAWRRGSAHTPATPLPASATPLPVTPMLSTLGDELLR